MSEFLAAVLARAAVMLLESLVTQLIKIIAARFLPAAGLRAV